MAVDIKKLSLAELIDYEKAARIVCSNYEKSVKMYDGSISSTPENVRQFEKYISTYNKILKELEDRINKI